jgi:hypothetical protein
MHNGALRVFRRILERLPENLSEERSALEHQIEQYETKRLMTRAKQALAARRFADARNELDALYERQRRLRFAVASILLRVAPEVVHWAYTRRMV